MPKLVENSLHIRLSLKVAQSKRDFDSLSGSVGTIPVHTGRTPLYVLERKGSRNGLNRLLRYLNQIGSCCSEAYADWGNPEFGSVQGRFEEGPQHLAAFNTRKSLRGCR
jgi:hypothetical protein